MSSQQSLWSSSLSYVFGLNKASQIVSFISSSMEFPKLSAIFSTCLYTGPILGVVVSFLQL